MKKQLLFVLLVASLPTLAQKKAHKGYFSLRGGLAMKDDINKGTALMSLGLSPTDGVGIGVGLGFIDFDSPYLPFTADISFFGKRGKISPVVIGSAGYGIYNRSISSVAVRGGFTGSINAGIALPVKKSKVIFTGGYSTYNFVNHQTRASAGTGTKVKTDVNLWTITAGVKI